MFPEGGAAGFLYMQEHHNVVGVKVEAKVVMEHLVVRQPRLGDHVWKGPPGSLRVR